MCNEVIKYAIIIVGRSLADKSAIYVSLSNTRYLLDKYFITNTQLNIQAKTQIRKSL